MQLDLEAIAQAVETARKDRGWNVRVFNEKVGYDNTTLNPVRKARRKVSEATYDAIDRAFGWPVGSTVAIGQGKPAPAESMQDRVSILEQRMTNLESLLTRRYGDLQQQ